MYNVKEQKRFIMKTTMQKVVLIVSLASILQHFEVEAYPAHHIKQPILNKESDKFQEFLTLCLNEAHLPK